MDRALELVGAGLERRHVVRLLGGAGEVLAVEDLRPRVVEDVDVVGRPGVLVVEQDLERLVGGRGELLLVELDVLGGERQRADGARAAGCR